MKQTISVLFILFVTLNSVFPQSEKDIQEPVVSFDSVYESFDHVFFVLGTLSDYMGRYQYVKREKQVDRYYPYEKVLVDFLTNYIKAELSIEVDIAHEDSQRIEMFSDDLSRTLNAFYDDSDNLKSKMYETDEQVYSFLTGVYYRYGDKIDNSIFKIQLANSPKHQICYDFLKRIGCENIFYQYLRNIPAQHIIYFEPTDILRKYLNRIETERLALKKAFHSQIVDMMKGNMTKEEVLNDLQRRKDQESIKIKNAFRK